MSKILKALTGTPIVVYRGFLRLTGNMNAAIMLSQAYYWCDKIPEDRDGWFYKTREEWQEECGLGRREQENARKILTENFDFWQENLQGLPAKMWYRLDLDLLAKALASMDEKAPPVGTKTPNREVQNVPTISKNTTGNTSKNISPNIEEDEVVGSKPVDVDPMREAIDAILSDYPMLRERIAVYRNKPLSYQFKALVSERDKLLASPSGRLHPHSSFSSAAARPLQDGRPRTCTVPREQSFYARKEGGRGCPN